MQDEFELFTPDAWFLGNAARQQLWQFPPLPDELVHTFIAYRLQLEETHIAALADRSAKAAFQNDFHTIAAALAATTGTYPSRPYQCAYFLLSFFYMPLLREAFTVREQQPGAFIALYDYTCGIAEVACEVFFAEGELAGRTDARGQHAYEAAGERLWHKPPPPSVTETMYTIGRAMDRKAGQLLTQDPTGNTLIAAAVAELREETTHRTKPPSMPRIEPYQNPQLFLAGAEYAQRLYTVLYPLSQ